MELLSHALNRRPMLALKPFDSSSAIWRRTIACKTGTSSGNRAGVNDMRRRIILPVMSRLPQCDHHCRQSDLLSHRTVRKHLVGTPLRQVISIEQPVELLTVERHRTRS